MTVLVGVRCTDGVVIGADSAATSAAGNTHLLKLASDKIVIVGDRVIVAGTGQIGLGQRFADQVKQAHDAKLFQQSAVNVAKALAAAGSNVAQLEPAKALMERLLGHLLRMQGNLLNLLQRIFNPNYKTARYISWQWVRVKP